MALLATALALPGLEAAAVVGDLESHVVAVHRQRDADARRPRMALDVMRLFERFNEAGVSFLIATHAIDLVERLGHRLVHLQGGRESQARPEAASRLEALQP